MFLDKHLSWDVRINQLCTKLSRANGILSKLRHNAPLEVCLQVYYAIFYSHLIYGCNIWGLTSLGHVQKYWFYLFWSKKQQHHNFSINCSLYFYETLESTSNIDGKCICRQKIFKIH